MSTTGENPSRVYSQTRMDSAWEFRHAYDEARKIKEAQDTFCASAQAHRWEEIGGLELNDFPEELRWESLVDVLRGKVKVRSSLCGIVHTYFELR